MVEPQHRQTIDLHDVAEDPEIAAACCIGHVETQAVIELLDKQESIDKIGTSLIEEEPEGNAEIANVLEKVNPL